MKTVLLIISLTLTGCANLGEVELMNDIGLGKVAQFNRVMGELKNMRPNHSSAGNTFQSIQYIEQTVPR